MGEVCPFFHKMAIIDGGRITPGNKTSGTAHQFVLDSQRQYRREIFLGTPTKGAVHHPTVRDEPAGFDFFESRTSCTCLRMAGEITTVGVEGYLAGLEP